MADDIPETPTVKTCTKCGETKALDCFYRDSRKKHGVAVYCKLCHCAVHRKSYEADPEKFRARRREYHANNREAGKAQSAAWREANGDRGRAQKRASYAAEPERHLARAAAYRATHRHIAREWETRRRAQKLSTSEPEEFTRAEIWDRDGGRCHLCHKRCDPNDWHLDHLVPLSRGGQHTRTNVAVSHPKCNMSRNCRGPAQLRILP